MTEQLVEFANALLGHLYGGLSHVNIFVSILFAGLTGAAVTDTVAVGGILIPAMKKQGYESSYSTAVTATSLYFMAGEVVVLLIITYVPFLSLWLPRVLGYMG